MNKHPALATPCGAPVLYGLALATTATPFDGDDLGGRRFVASQSVAGFSRFGFNDLASSAGIHDGAWQPCTDADFRGDCRTFGPGDYPVRPPGLVVRVSSERRISSDCSYHRNPHWGG